MGRRMCSGARVYRVQPDPAYRSLSPTAPQIGELHGTATVHSIVHTDRYYREVEAALLKARSKADAITILTDIGKRLLNGTFPY